MESWPDFPSKSSTSTCTATKIKIYRGTRLLYCNNSTPSPINLQKMLSGAPLPQAGLSHRTSPSRFESFRILINGRKVTSLIRDALYKLWGYEAAKDLFQQRKIVSPSNFDLICWDAVSDAMLVYLRMFQVWVTKTVSHLCGSNLQLARFRESTTDACSCCGIPEESAAHITRGRNDGRTEMFDESVSLFIEWLSETHMQEDLILCIERYLL